MANQIKILGVLALATTLAATAAGAQQHVYPLRGQSHAKQHKDEVHCSQWARSQSGYDPAHPPVVAQAQPAPVTGSGSRARGAAAGALFGAIGGNAGAGAAVGAVAGGVTRRVRNANAAHAQNAANAQHVADLEASYYRARRACLSGRGYSVE
ncbi:MAG: hypothetical protein JO127_09800 [Caulobacteraceae bacterium]|nr:hypothetical protein [Caulobacteraceae bacterium]